MEPHHKMSIFVDPDARGLKKQSRVIKQCAYEARNEVSCEVSQYLDSWVSELIDRGQVPEYIINSVLESKYRCCIHSSFDGWRRRDATFFVSVKVNVVTYSTWSLSMVL